MKWFLDVGHSRLCKHRQLAGGDVFLSRKEREEDRTIVVLSDGLGSGIKANVLATLTATMAGKFVASYRDIRHTAGIIMATLPVCKVRKVSYATFSIADIQPCGTTRLMEYDNPGVLVVRGDRIIRPARERVEVQGTYTYKKNPLLVSTVGAELGDRIILCSDGVTQSGMGTRSYPLGWGEENLERFVLDTIGAAPEISARELATRITGRALANDLGEARDDTTCGVIYFRRPRRLMLVTGPPVNPARDRELADAVTAFPGRTILCGGTTANIIARELDRELSVELAGAEPGVPPASVMPGIALVTEGILTLGRTAEILEHGTEPVRDKSAAGRLVAELLESDDIHFLVGTRINEAHQDPNIPVELEIRRNVVKKIVRLLETDYLKKVTLNFI